jgi:hypothetical protein
MDVALPVQIFHPDGIPACQVMPCPERRHDLLPKQRKSVKAIVRLLAGNAVDGDLQVTLEETLLQFPGIGVRHLQLEPFMPRLHRTNEVNDLARSDGAHDAELQGRMLQLGKVPGLALGFLHLAVDLLQMRADNPAELRQVRVGTLPVEESAAELLLQLPDRPCQGGLSHMAALGRVGEVQVLAQGEEVPHLVHFHGTPPASSASKGRRGTHPCQTRTLLHRAGDGEQEQGAPNMPFSSAESIPCCSPRGLGSQSANKLLHGYQGDGSADVRKGT